MARLEVVRITYMIVLCLFVTANSVPDTSERKQAAPGAGRGGDARDACASGDASCLGRKGAAWSLDKMPARTLLAGGACESFDGDYAFRFQNYTGNCDSAVRSMFTTCFSTGQLAARLATDCTAAVPLPGTGGCQCKARYVPTSGQFLLESCKVTSGPLAALPELRANVTGTGESLRTDGRPFMVHFTLPPELGQCSFDIVFTAANVSTTAPVVPTMPGPAPLPTASPAAGPVLGVITPAAAASPAITPSPTLPATAPTAAAPVVTPAATTQAPVVAGGSTWIPLLDASTEPPEARAVTASRCAAICAAQPGCSIFVHGSSQDCSNCCWLHPTTPITPAPAKGVTVYVARPAGH